MLAFASRITALRLERGLTQQTLARAAGIDPGQLSRLERGMLPSLPLVVRIAGALGVAPADLFASAAEQLVETRGGGAEQLVETRGALMAARDASGETDLDGVMTLAEFERVSTLSRSTTWRLCREDPILRAARIQLTSTRAGLLRSGVAKFMAARAGGNPEAA